MKPPTVAVIRTRIRVHSTDVGAKAAARFHKTGPGQYADGQVFLGLDAPTLRSLAREFRDLPLDTVAKLLQSQSHDERTVALMVMVEQMKRGDSVKRKQVIEVYRSNMRFVNSWALVDCSAPGIVGCYLQDRNRTWLDKLARSKSLWERRIAIVATQWFIRLDQFDDTLRIAENLLDDEHDLIHKATGWMLREVGKRDQSRLEQFLTQHYSSIPRTTLRYAIERFPEAKRQKFMRGSLS